MNVLVVNDLSWDNFAIVSKRLNPRCINPNHRINYFYGKHMQYVSNVCNQNLMHLVRLPFLEDKQKQSIENSLKYVKFCIIFHNFTEYNTISSFYIKTCQDNKVPYFIFSEHCEKFYMNGEYIACDKFKNRVREIEFSDREIIVNIPETFSISHEITCPKNIVEVINNLRSRYQISKDEKESKKIIYEENPALSRQTLKSGKEMSYLDFMANKRKWIKETFQKH
tara:strand:+ start:2459 stop:3130 length:672 start_codon:yes stop_codon:yes gene_type:complete